MRWIATATLVVLQINILPTRAQEIHHSAVALGLLSVAQDPWTAAAAGGPASGWGIAAAAANPATLMFGPDGSAAVTLPFSQDLILTGASSRARAGIGGGFCIFVAPVMPSYSEQTDWEYHSRSVLSRDRGARLTLAVRPDTSWALGVNVKYLLSDLEPDQIVLDFGVRYEGFLPGLTLVERAADLMPTSRRRWPAGLSVGLTAANLKVARMPNGAPADRSFVPTLRSAGLAYRPIVTRSVCLSLNATHYWWGRELLPPDQYEWGTEFHYPDIATGIVAELDEFFELGMSVSRDQPSGQWDVSWLVGIGPPFARVMWSLGTGIQEAGYYDSDMLVRVMLRFLFPVETRQRELPPEKPYDWWR
jgi:hypothetical protein